MKEFIAPSIVLSSTEEGNVATKIPFDLSSILLESDDSNASLNVLCTPLSVSK